ncbi:D-alanyl transfer protein [Secundilactobacillus odoratitofui DSM 19909 = JCM 15043]|uniref:Protein DltD n=1 Tax=Secundilactobacillus odoratitofui DSM 19909 = JCM 15043 TaxID=1423776 RepID=A0A0R1LZA3_9LACO|nr:D-alanyl-lipoteichoic acid biosynthesis protein DltD [Secundilactobacillus odoratitofui]KRK98548.1 D-alanyl transfer protein [Secundilactobacillus odoratitofui DSM 19909 = JCM 15043]
MKKHRLALAVMPVVIAVAIVALLFGLPRRAPHYQKKTLQRAAISLSTNVFKGQAIKTQAMDRGYVPFFGSSELARLDAMHPSVLAAKYKRSYRPFLLGRAGTQSLAQYFAMQDMTPQLYRKKAVMIISPQWFTKHGQLREAFAIYYSPLATSRWLLQAKPSEANQYAAKRLLNMKTSASKGTMGAAVKRIARGKAITVAQRRYLQVRLTMLQHEDQLFGQIGLNDKLKKLKHGKKQLPKHDNATLLDSVAVKLGRHDTSNNRYGIDNSLYSHRLSHGRMKRLKNSQRHYDYRQSPEYADLQLVLTTFKQQHTNVMFVIPPVNAKWSRYTGLSTSMMQQTSTKITQQLRRQGFTNIVDLSRDGGQDYFMQDTIHLGWRGWLAVDKRVQPFLENAQPLPKLHLNDAYFSKDWQRQIVK